jgi:2-isopropylmalate synthase
MNINHVKIFDTTLRDGQQCPGAGMSVENNIKYAHLAARLGLDVIEAGFPSASKSEFSMVNTIMKELLGVEKGPIVAGLCQLREAQIDLTIEALLPGATAKRARLHVYLPVDPELMTASLGSYASQKSKIIEDLHRLTKKTAETGMEVEFSPEGYSRMRDNFDFVTDLFRAFISAGGGVINCPDTIGGACRLQGKEYFVNSIQRHADIMAKEFPDHPLTWSAHCHNDFGLALDNSMNAVFNGPVRQIEGCINGIGERAGNVPLEQCIMYLKHFGHYFDEKAPLYTQINTEMLQTVSDFVSQYMLTRQAHWPITGDNAAKHTSGGHTNAVINNPLAYQPFDPKEVGKTISFIFGPSSGGNHAKMIIEEFGYRCDDQEKAGVAQFIKDYFPDRRKGITDKELLEGYLIYRQPIRALEFNYSKTGEDTQLEIKGKFFDQEAGLSMTYHGKDSALAALKESINTYMPGMQIESYNSRAMGIGVDAESKSTIVISTSNGNHFTGCSQDKDITLSALKALIDAVNQAYIEEHYRVGDN